MDDPQEQAEEEHYQLYCRLHTIYTNAIALEYDPVRKSALQALLGSLIEDNG